MQPLPDLLDQVARTRVRQNSAATDLTARRRINFSDAGAPWTLTDDPTNEEVVVSVLGGATNQTPTTNVTVAAGYGYVAVSGYEIPAGVTLELGAGAYMEIL